jgi:hypothetical protein
MKITMDVECTPEEARAFLGLPDVRPMQEHLMREVQDRMTANIRAMEPEVMLRTWLPATLNVNRHRSFDPLREAQRLDSATQNGNPVGSRSAPMMTPPTLRIRLQRHARNGSRLKGQCSMLIYTAFHKLPRTLRETFKSRSILTIMRNSRAAIEHGAARLRTSLHTARSCPLRPVRSLARTSVHRPCRPYDPGA